MGHTYTENPRCLPDIQIELADLYQSWHPQMGWMRTNAGNKLAQELSNALRSLSAPVPPLRLGVRSLREAPPAALPL